MEVITEDLQQPRWEREVAYLADFLNAKGEHELTVSYGWGCSLDMDDLYDEVPMPVSELREWIARSMVSGTFILGESILHIYSRNRNISITLEPVMHFAGLFGLIRPYSDGSEQQRMPFGFNLASRLIYNGSKAYLLS